MWQIYVALWPTKLFGDYLSEITSYEMFGTNRIFRSTKKVQAYFSARVPELDYRVFPIFGTRVASNRSCPRRIVVFLFTCSVVVRFWRNNLPKQTRRAHRRILLRSTGQLVKTNDPVWSLSERKSVHLYGRRRGRVSPKTSDINEHFRRSRRTNNDLEGRVCVCV